MSSCFEFDYDLRELGLEVAPNTDAPLLKHTKFSEDDENWLRRMDEACK